MRQPSVLQSKTVRLAIIGTLGLIALWWLGMKPAQAHLATAAAERTEQIETALGNSEKKRLLSEAEKKYASLSSDLGRLKGVIPEASETGSFVSALEELAARSGLQILSLSTKIQPKAAPRATTTTSSKNKTESTPAASTKTVEQELLQSFYGTTVEVRFSGNYASLRSFVQLVRQMERFVSIASINLSANRQSTAEQADILTGTINMSIFHRQAAKDDSTK